MEREFTISTLLLRKLHESLERELCGFTNTKRSIATVCFSQDCGAIERLIPLER